MKTQRFTNIKLDHDLINNDLNIIKGFEMSNIYDEFVCGGNLKSCMLWNSSGNTTDNVLISYDGKAKLTKFGLSLAYINKIITDNFNMDFLKYARILMLTPNSVFMPHRDYLELKKDLLRFHIPIKTDNNCYNSEDGVVFHMDLGDIWYINASNIHSAASFSETDRLHLVLDFDYTDIKNILLFNSKIENNIPNDAIQKRRDITYEEIKNIFNLCKLIDKTNFFDIFSILIKKYFFYDIGVMIIYEWLKEVAKLSNNETVIDMTKYWESHCLYKR